MGNRIFNIKNGWSGTSRCHPILICTTPCAVQR
nr:MAG TPA: hypothetical protein [Caudoviricetes sp.]